MSANANEKGAITAQAAIPAVGPCSLQVLCVHVQAVFMEPSLTFVTLDLYKMKRWKSESTLTNLALSVFLNRCCPLRNYSICFHIILMNNHIEEMK